MDNTSTISPSVEIFQMVIYIPTFIFGLVFNLLALWMVFCRIKKWVEATTYVTALIVFDSLLLFTLPFKMTAYREGNEWSLGSSFCSFLEGLYFLNMYGSILTSVCICVDRYIAIQYPFYAIILRSPKKATFLCLFLFTLVWGITIWYLCKPQKNKRGPQCFYGFSVVIWMNVALIITLELVFFISSILMTFCTAHITFTLKRKTQLDPSISSARKSVRILLGNLFIFLFAFGPFHLSLLLYYFVRNGIISADLKETMRVFIQVSLCLANTNCCLDGLFYYFVFKDFLHQPRTR
ncbi:hypothetical protein XENTR_v10014786 [Xenopus tropicalis]|uniref:G-protein coupled receptors family 1 profile domain-containing protein n=1 Tax=Xenopus tropicalis TaxID=8364 RepID=A0A6I8S7D4_XENTR|nr:hypothetical protein XENTR_v10014786 [Xenopus tropicalis]|eukprot:XP_002933414.1 PREDICTED: G-protein coupled receptor 55-like [Xenopus tropicalis]